MKRIWILLIISACIVLGACGEPSYNIAETDETESYDREEQDLLTDESPTEASYYIDENGIQILKQEYDLEKDPLADVCSGEYQALIYGKGISNDFMELSMPFAHTGYCLRPEKFDVNSNDISEIRAEDGNVFIYIICKIKNISNAPISPTNSVLQMIVGYEFVYDGEIVIDQDNTLKDECTLQPGEERTAIIYSEVPDKGVGEEVAFKRIVSIQLRWGMDDRFGAAGNGKYKKVSSWNNCEIQYKYYVATFS